MPLRPGPLRRGVAAGIARRSLQLLDLLDERGRDGGRSARCLHAAEGEDLLTVYRFNTMAASHHFCSRCGIHVYHQRRADPSQVGVNVACLDGASPYDFAEVPVMDGINHPLDNGGQFRRAGTLRFEAEKA